MRYWSEDYDWQRVPNQLSRYENFMTEVDEVGIHCLHVRSPHNQAQPLVITHGWPGSVLEFLNIIEPLTNPTEYGGTPADAFHLVIPNLPGFGFSGKPTAAGCGVERIAAMWDELMLRFDNTYIAQGGDWGSLVTHALLHAGTHCLAGHIILPMVIPDDHTMTSDDPVSGPASPPQCIIRNMSPATPSNKAPDPRHSPTHWRTPVGQMSWIIEKYAQWTDCEESGARHPRMRFSETLLDIVTHYWMTNTAAAVPGFIGRALTNQTIAPLRRPSVSLSKGVIPL